MKSETSPGWGFHIRVYEHEETRIEARWNRMPLYSEFWRLYCNRQNGAALVTENQRMPMRAGRLYLVPPRFPGWGEVRGCVGHAYGHFDVIGLPHGLAPLLFPRPIEVASTSESDALLRHWLKDLRQPTPAGLLPALLRAESLAAQAFAECWERAAVSESAVWRAWMERSPRMARLEEWMGTRLDEDLSVARLAEWIGFTPDHFRRQFVRIFGMNPSRYVTQLRIKEAARLLLFSQTSIDEVAESTGFLDRFHFTRVFRNQTGENPAAYRRRNLNYAGAV